ncbi:MAG: glycerophosphodiester phosphodiesterase [Acidobacteriota bacterium]|nr:glycerophosphodiester phosphodiesterase [Acidobacteriota bacterium]
MGRLVYAHRGGLALSPENTIAAFDRGMSEGADGLELDVRLSRDGVAVVHHDATLERTTNRSGPVSALTADELARADAGHQFASGGGFPFRGQGIGVPRLDEVLRRYPGARLIIEMKGDSPALGEAVADVVTRAGAAERALLASFSLRTVRAARRARPEVRTGASTPEVRTTLFRSWLGLAPSAPEYFGFQLPEKAGRLRVISPRFVRTVTGAGLSVAVWVVNEEADMRRLLDWGVTGLITDRPDLAVPLVRAANL